MGEDRPSLGANLPAESAHVVNTLLATPSLSVREDTGAGNIKWVANKDFTVEVGKKQIMEYVRTWSLKLFWHYGLDFLCTTELGYRTFYHYRARWSTPTAQRPIQGTASVYFVVDVQKTRPQTLPVMVHFAVEAGRSVHTAGRVVFKEKWLTDIIESKTLLRSQVDL